MARAASRKKLRVAEETQYADLGSVQEFAEGLKETHLHCRELGHNWRPFTVGRHRDGGFERVLRCTRCKTKRIQQITSKGMVMVNKYVHAEGYLSQGMGRIVGEGRGLLRLESMKRIVEKGD